MFTLPDNPEQRARIEAHWREVREGLRQPEPHEFGADARERIEAHRFKARKHIEAAAREMRLADELAQEAAE